jgi:hypothetical protein
MHLRGVPVGAMRAVAHWSYEAVRDGLSRFGWGVEANPIDTDMRLGVNCVGVGLPMKREVIVWQRSERHSVRTAYFR